MKTPSHFELYQTLRKAPVPPTRPHKNVKGKGSYSRKGWKRGGD